MYIHVDIQDISYKNTFHLCRVFVFCCLKDIHSKAVSKGLKTGLYYLRTKAAADAIKFTVDVDTLKRLGI